MITQFKRGKGLREVKIARAFDWSRPDPWVGSGGSQHLKGRVRSGQEVRNLTRRVGSD